MSDDELIDASPSLASESELDLTDSSALLLELRDIYLPEPVQSTALSLGVWLLVFFLLALVSFCAFFFTRWRRRRDPLWQALSELEGCYVHWKSSGSASLYLEQSAVILKRLAIRSAGRDAIARLSGHDWVQWLNNSTGQALPERAQQALVAERYRESPEVDIKELHRTLAGWMRRYKRVCRA